MNSHFLSRRRHRYAVIPAAILAVSMAGFGTSYALAEDVAADWTVTETPTLDSYYEFTDVEVTNDGAVAVGTTDEPAPEGVVGAHWDGEKWSESLIPEGISLFDVAVTDSGDEAWAVGGADDGGSFTAHFDGSDWKPVDTPQPELAETPDATLHGVNASGSSVWAVGCGGDGEAAAPLAQSYDGEAWELHDVPLPEGYDSACLNGVQHISADEVWAVGTAYNEDGDVPYVVRYDGEGFEEVEGPEVDAPWAGLTDVMTLAVGYQEAAPLYMAGYQSDEDMGDKQPIVFEFDGEKWTQSESNDVVSNISDMGRGLGGGAWLVADSPEGEPLLLAYEDGELQEVDAPAEAGTLAAVASGADADSPVWVVGSAEGDDAYQGFAAYQE